MSLYYYWFNLNWLLYIFFFIKIVVDLRKFLNVGLLNIGFGLFYLLVYDFLLDEYCDL